MKRLIDYDPFTGIETWHELDHAEQKTRIYYVNTLDADPSLEYCKRRALDENYSKDGIKEDWWHYGHIPNWLMLKWYTEHGIPVGDAEGYNKMLNRPEWKGFKTTTKHHGVADKMIFLG